MLNTYLLLIILITLLIIGSIIWQFYIEKTIYAKKHSKVTIDGLNIKICSSGQANPTVILESGCGDFSMTWGLVQPEVAKFCKVFSYDRAGLGSSDKSPYERSFINQVKELKKIIEKAGLKGPFILVGQSLGGLITLRFALEYPNDVIGVILVDSSHENQEKEIIKALPRMKLYQKLMPIMAYSALFGIPRILGKCIKKSKFSSDYLKEYRLLLTTRKNMRTSVDEFASFTQADDPFFNKLKTNNTLKDKPLVVITQGLYDYGMSPKMRPLFKEVWLRLQRDLILLSNNSRHIIAENSGHIIQQQEPELIVNAIYEMVRMYKDKLLEK